MWSQVTIKEIDSYCPMSLCHKTCHIMNNIFCKNLFYHFLPSWLNLVHQRTRSNLVSSFTLKIFLTRPNGISDP